MLGKLLKYDLRSMLRVFAPLWLALLAVSVVNGLASDPRYYLRSGTLMNVFLVLYVALLIAVMVLTAVLIILRFYNGLLKDEGYLMFTLPVRPWQLVTAKCLSATIITILSLIAAVLSLFLLAVNGVNVELFSAAITTALPDLVGEMWLTLLLLALYIVALVVSLVTHVYASLAIGHLAGRRRIAVAVAAYIGINLALSTLSQLFLLAANRFRWEVEWNIQYSGESFNLLLFVGLLVSALEIAAFFVITERILSRRLNLD